MASQFIILKDTGADRDHLRAHASSCPDIFRRVANEAGDSILAKSAPRLVHTLDKAIGFAHRSLGPLPGFQS